MGNPVCQYLERYRSGHNETVLKIVCLSGHMGSNPILSVRPVYGRVCIETISRGGAEEACRGHSPEAGGSNPPPATRTLFRVLIRFGAESQQTGSPPVSIQMCSALVRTKHRICIPRCGSVWLERPVWDREIVGSNLTTSTRHFHSYDTKCLHFVHSPSGKVQDFDADPLPVWAD